MKNTRRCPKCNHTDILKVKGDIRGYGVGNNIVTGMTIFLLFWFTDTCVAPAAILRSGLTPVILKN